MRHDVYVRPSNNGFLATIAAVPERTIEAATREEVIVKAHAELKNIIAQGFLVSIETDETERHKKPLSSFAGMWANDSTFDDFLAAMKAYREELNAEWEQEQLAEAQTQE